MRKWMVTSLWLAAWLPALAQLAVGSHDRGGVRVVDVSGPLTGATVDQFRASLEAVRAEHPRGVVVNFAAMTALDTQGQRELMDSFARSTRGKIRLVWCNLRPNHREALLVTHLLGTVPFYASEDQAVASF